MGDALGLGFSALASVMRPQTEKPPFRTASFLTKGQRAYLVAAFRFAGALLFAGVFARASQRKPITTPTLSTFTVMKADPKLDRAAALRNAMLRYMNDKSSPLNAYPAFLGAIPPSSVRRLRDDGQSGHASSTSQNAGSACFSALLPAS